LKLICDKLVSRKKEIFNVAKNIKNNFKIDDENKFLLSLSLTITRYKIKEELLNEYINTNINDFEESQLKFLENSLYLKVEKEISNFQLTENKILASCNKDEKCLEEINDDSLIYNNDKVAFPNKEDLKISMNENNKSEFDFIKLQKDFSFIVEEMKKLKSDIKNQDDKYEKLKSESQEEIKKLKSENEKLKSENEKLKSAIENQDEKYEKILFELEKVKSDNVKLKKCLTNLQFLDYSVNVREVIRFIFRRLKIVYFSSNDSQYSDYETIIKLKTIFPFSNASNGLIDILDCLIKTKFYANEIVHPKIRISIQSFVKNLCHIDKRSFTNQSLNLINKFLFIVNNKNNIISSGMDTINVDQSQIKKYIHETYKNI